MSLLFSLDVYQQKSVSLSRIGVVKIDTRRGSGSGYGSTMADRVRVLYMIKSLKRCSEENQEEPWPICRLILLIHWLNCFIIRKQLFKTRVKQRYNKTSNKVNESIYAETSQKIIGFLHSWPFTMLESVCTCYVSHEMLLLLSRF